MSHGNHFTRRLLIVIPAADKNAANTAALQFDPVGGSNTFTVGLSASGNSPATHYWASLQARENVFQGISAIVSGSFPNAILEEYELGTNRPDELLVELGLKRIENP